MSTFESTGGPLVHEALLYRDREELKAVAREFVADAARAGEPVLAVLPGDNLKHVREALGADGADVRFEDMIEVGRNPARLLAIIQDWVEEHGGRARVISEPVWPGRSYAETAECLRHEALLNHALAGWPATVLCPYDAEHLDAEVLEGVELTHPRLRDGTGGRDSERFEDPLRVSLGERWPLGEPLEPISEHIFAGDLRSLRRAVVDDPCLHGLTPERRDDVVFVVNEAASNALKYGHGGCTARIWRDGRSVVSEVITDTVLPDLLAGRRRPHPEAPSGRGLWLINQLCDLVELRTGRAGTTLRMHVQ